MIVIKGPLGQGEGSFEVELGKSSGPSIEGITRTLVTVLDLYYGWNDIQSIAANMIESLEPLVKEED